MTIANTFASKLFVGVVAIAMALTLVAPAQAQTEAELQAQIDQLMATIAALQAQAGQTTVQGGSNADVCPYTWTRSLSQGSTGADVMALQQFLNSMAETQVAPVGAAGSAGNETQYYGPATAAAVSNFQVLYRAEILTPVALVNPTGYFGPSSMAQANALCAAAMPGTGTDDDDDGTDDDDDDSAELQGEGTLGTFEVDDDEDEVQEGAEDEVVMVITAEADDGDIEIDRMTFTLVGGVEETDPWDAFNEVSLWVDGDKIADFDASDEDEYLDEDDGEFRFSGLDLILREDEEVEIMVAVSVANSVDGADADTEDWDLSVLEVRYFDADGVASDDDSTDDLDGTTPPSETFTIVEEGIDDEAEIGGNSANPDATTLNVDEGNDDSDEYVVHVFDIEIGEDSSDLVLDDAFATVTVANVNPGAEITGGQEDVIAEIIMTIDGEEVEGEAVASATSGLDDADDAILANTGSTDVMYRFEFDGLDLDADTDYEVEISIIFAGQDGNYVNGVTVVTEVGGADWEVEGLSSDNLLTGTDDSEAHILSNSDATVSDHNWVVASGGNFLDFIFTVEAGDEDFDVLLSSFDYATTGTATSYDPVLTRASGDADAISGGFEVQSGDDATFRIRFNVGGSNGDYLDVTATSVAGQPIPDDEEVSPTATRNISS